MVNALDIQMVARAGHESLCQLVAQFVHTFPTDDDGAPLISVVALTLESLAFHLKSPNAAIVRECFEEHFDLDVLFGFLTVPDDQIVAAACTLIEAYAQPLTRTELLAAQHNLVLGLAHPQGQVRVLVLGQLRKLEADDWTPALVVAALDALSHPSIPVFDAYTSLIRDEQFARVLLADRDAAEVLTTVLLPHRTHGYRALDLLLRVVRLLPAQEATAAPLHAATHVLAVTQRARGHPLDWAVLCEQLAAHMSSVGDAGRVPGPSAAVAAFLADAGVLAVVLDAVERALSPTDDRAATAGAADTVSGGAPVLVAWAAHAATSPDQVMAVDAAVSVVARVLDDRADSFAEIPAMATLRAVAAVTGDGGARLVAADPLRSTLARHYAALSEASRARGGSGSVSGLTARWRSGLLQLAAAHLPVLRGGHGNGTVPVVADPDGMTAAAVAAATSSFDGDLQVSGMAYLLAAAATAASDREVQASVVRRLDWLMARDKAEAPEMRRLRYDTVVALVEADRAGTWAAGSTEEVRRVREWIAQGPYHTQRSAAVTVSDAMQ
ncbi:hypothetical protein BC828DRAFT_26456 [Blastocladiella britannica]|nr:hypothetical protein BC828DRAFT_26456 [Blastocladiella britannica]